ncbi:MAG: glycosyltransferase family 2 protein [Paludibacterium sp.]|uniref:glycosyltransferase family 2 protein n=1 Tax=Paludibacterium sp. TaxID=1917523 RepID=UPI0025EA4206|nr:glycosyltransferase family 2 protein [Paludibacterium sp.]MBV8045734.1 glycosyltransferase family 2 protein [Paludibacterium sp.]MBV8648067.1 glycosyltransferase family 2 protein [Paludibacterium sp.]
MTEEFVPEYLLQLRAAERPADPLVSCIVPAYNEAENIVLLLHTLHQILLAEGLRHELIVVDDGSRDATVERVLGIKDQLPVTLVQLSRNFGKELALTAGIDLARGDVAVLIDGDFQHPPEMIPAFIANWRKGYDMVYSVRSSRDGESLAKRWFTRVFYALLNTGAQLKIPENTQDFRVLDRCILDALRQMPERNRFMKGIYNWVGFTRLAVETHTNDRLGGQSSFNLYRLLGLGLTGLTAFSNVPLRVWTFVGSSISLASIAYALYVILDTLLHGNDQHGWPTLIVAIMFLGGVQLLSIGVLGEYIGRIFTEVKQRPAYFISRITHLSGSDEGRE